MDFTGSVGRIVDDPEEARMIAENEGRAWKRKWRPFARRTPITNTTKEQVDNGIHTTQPWYHGDLRREAAVALIRKGDPGDG